VIKPESAADYYRHVADYYDDDALDFEQRYEENPVLKRIRAEFREITEEHDFREALEIGCGPGFDVVYFASRFPDRRVCAIDVSPGMIGLARKNTGAQNLKNAQLAVGSVEDIAACFPGRKFDLVYVYFGGLNTVVDLELAAGHINRICTADATLVLTFVNRYYITEIPLWLASGRFDKAFERICNRWRGYSDHRKIPSRPYSAHDIKRAFSSGFRITKTRGFSIFYPAWYRSHLLGRFGKVSDWLWKIDKLISSTPFWNTGEYSLYVMKKR